MSGFLAEIKALGRAEGPYHEWRLTESPEKRGIDHQLAVESIASHSSTLGHAVRAIQGGEYEAGKQILLQLREAVDQSLKALGEGTALTGER